MAWSQSVAFAGGTAGTTAYGSWDRILFSSGSWTVGKFWTIAATIGATASDLNLGAGTLLMDSQGNFVNPAVTFLLTLADRVYAANGNQLNFSANDNATLWDQFDVDTAGNTGAGVINFLSGYGQQDALYSLASFQGRIALIFRYRTELWNYDADPANFSRAQILLNVGTSGAFSAASLGDLDVVFLDDAGVKSLRALVTTLNASIVNIGSPIDQTIVDLFHAGSTAAASCAVIEPFLKQYWLSFGGFLFVLSYYPEAKITAWSKLTPVVEVSHALTLGNYDGSGNYSFTLVVGTTYTITSLGNATSLTWTNVSGSTALSAGDIFVASTADTLIAVGTPAAACTSTINYYDFSVAFSPDKMVVYQGQVYIHGADYKIYYYGGANNNTFDNIPATAELPWLDGKQPAQDKNFSAIDVAISGMWLVQFGSDPKSGTLTTVLINGSITSPDANKDSTYDLLTIPYEGPGTHFKFKAYTLGKTKAKLSAVTAHYNTGDRT